MLTVHRLAADGSVESAGLADASDLGRGGRGPLWVEAVAPGPAEVDALKDRFGLHHLALEDALKEGHPPKLEDFDDHLFLITHAPERGATPTGETRKIALFMGADWVVTVLRMPLDDALSGLGVVRARLDRLLPSPIKLVHAVVDGMTDAIELHVDGLFERIEALEEQVYTRRGEELMPSVGGLRGEVLHMLRIVRSQRDVAGQLLRGEHRLVPLEVTPYLRDVYDHLLRVHDLLESAREAVSGVRDAYLATVNNRLSDIMRVLTVIATVMMPLTLVSGIYGMNVAPIPGSQGPAVFWLILGGMALLAGGMLLYFRRKRWI